VGRREDADLQFVKHRILALEREVDEHGELLQGHNETLKDHENRITQVEGVLKRSLRGWMSWVTTSACRPSSCTSFKVRSRSCSTSCPPWLRTP